ncbi:MAG: lysylphosphatidylglycerol synthase transmembrane domain-containing protein [Candidatus Kryptoniota bacterium]
MKTKNKAVRTIIGIGIAAIFIFFAFRSISLTVLIRDASKANFYILILATLVVLFSHFVRALRWRVILNEIKDNVSVSNTWGSIMVGYLFNNFVPRLGEVVRAYTTGRIEEISVSAVLGTIVLERLFDMLSAGILLGIALLTYHGDIISSFPFLRTAGIILIFGSVTTCVFLYISSASGRFRKFLLSAIKFFLPTKLASRVQKTILSFMESFSILRSSKRLLKISIYTALIWLIYVYTMYIPFFAFQFQTALHLNFYDAFILILITSIAWMIPSPGATGVYHLFISKALITLFGVPEDEALAYAVLTHLFAYLAITVVGAIFVYIFSAQKNIKPLKDIPQE